MKNRIIFVDEEKEQHDYFADYMDKYEDQVEVICLFPHATIQETIDYIEEQRPDAIVSDYKLNEIKKDIKYNVPFDGASLVDSYLNDRPHFPCFVLTSYDEEAIKICSDVNIIYQKIVFSAKEEGKITFAERIIQQIANYKHEIQRAQSELNFLLEKRKNGGTNASEEQSIIDLDSFIEKSLGKKYSIPETLKTPSNVKRLNELLEKVNEMIAKYNMK